MSVAMRRPVQRGNIRKKTEADEEDAAESEIVVPIVPKKIIKSSTDSSDRPLSTKQSQPIPQSQTPQTSTGAQSSASSRTTDSVFGSRQVKEPAPAPHSNLFASGGSYSTQDIEALKQKQKPTLGSRALSGVGLPASNTSAPGVELNAYELEAMNVDLSELVDAPEKVSQPDSLLQQYAERLQADQHRSMEIVDEQRIDHARAKRERLRGIADGRADFIPLNQDGGGDLTAMPTVTLMGRTFAADEKAQIDDNDDEAAFEDNQGSRLSMASLVQHARRPRAGAGSSAAVVHDDWEAEQLRRIAKRGSGRASEAALRSQSSDIAPMLALGNGPTTASTVSPAGQRFYEEVTVDQVRDSMQRALREMRDLSGDRQLRADKLDAELVAADHQIAAVDKDMHSLSERYQFHQRMRDDVRALCALLVEKNPLIDAALDERRHQRHEAGSERAELTAASDRELRDLAFGEDSGDSEVELDEFGRDVGAPSKEAKQRRRIAREKRRAACLRRVKPVFQEVQLDYSCPEGVSSSSDSECDEEYASWRRRAHHQHQSLCADASLIMTDASEDYASLQPVLARLSEWRSQYPQSYRDAFVPLSTPQMCAPYVRLELLGWDPVSVPLQTMHWLTQLGAHMSGSTDPDELSVLPKLVSKLVVPQFVEFLEHQFDPFSARSSAIVAATIHSIRQRCGLKPEAVATQMLLKALDVKWQQAVQSLSLPALCRRDPSAQSRAEPRVRTRFFYRAVKLTRLMCACFDVSASAAPTGPFDVLSGWTGAAAAAECRASQDADQSSLNGVLLARLHALIADHLLPFLQAHSSGVAGTVTSAESDSRGAHVAATLRHSLCALLTLPPRLVHGARSLPASSSALSALIQIARHAAAAAQFAVASGQCDAGDTCTIGTLSARLASELAWCP